MPALLLFSVLVILACILGNKISSRLGIPALLIFIVLGMLFGSDGLLKISFDDFVLSEQLCSIALVFIIFYGGFGTKWSKAKPVAVPAVLLSTVGVILTAGAVGLFCYYAIGIDFLESMLIGAVISSTDAASVFSILRSKQLNLKYNTASLLEVESGSNDPCAYMLTMIILALMLGKSSTGGTAYLVFAQLVYGVGFGVLTAFAVLYVSKKLRSVTDGFDTVFIFASVLFAYAAPSIIDGNGYLSVYIYGIILGNNKLGNQKMLVHFFDGITGLMQILVFFLLGLLSFPSELPKIIGPAILIALFLTFIARPLTVFLLLTPFRCKLNQQLLISFAGLRGAASIVFAIMATIHPAYLNNDLFHMIFFIVLFSILFQGALLPLAAQRLDMISDDDAVAKTFSDYSDEISVRFIKFTIHQDHAWADKTVRDIVLPPETLLVKLERGQEIITPHGDTRLKTGDILTLGALAANEDNGIKLNEVTIGKYDEWTGKKLSALHLDDDKLIVMIIRQDDIIIPHGDTILLNSDRVVVQSK